MKRYRNIADREVLDKRPGIEFFADLDTVTEHRLVDGGFIQVVGDNAEEEANPDPAPSAGKQEE